MEPRTGFEPATYCLQNSCSTVELPGRKLKKNKNGSRGRTCTRQPLGYEPSKLLLLHSAINIYTSKNDFVKINFRSQRLSYPSI